MSYASLVTKNVNFAFKAIKDLATDVTLTKKAVTGFDFGTGANTADPDVVLVTTAVITASEKGGSSTPSSRNTQRKSAMLKREDVGDVTFYDTITIAAEVWTLGKVIGDNGFVVTVEIFKEV